LSESSEKVAAASIRWDAARCRVHIFGAEPRNLADLVSRGM